MRTDRRTFLALIAAAIAKPQAIISRPAKAPAEIFRPFQIYARVTVKEAGSFPVIESPAPSNFLVRQLAIHPDPKTTVRAIRGAFSSGHLVLSEGSLIMLESPLWMLPTSLPIQAYGQASPAPREPYIIEPALHCSNQMQLKISLRRTIPEACTFDVLIGGVVSVAI